MTAGELAEQMRLTGVMQGGRVGRAVDIVAEMFSDPDYTTFITLSGALIPGGQRVILRDLIKDGYIDAVMTNGANMIHDIVESMGRTHYQGSLNVDDEKLYEEGYNRAYDVFIENDTFVDIEEYVGKIIDDIPERNGTGLHSTSSSTSWVQESLTRNLYSRQQQTRTYQSSVPDS